MDMTSLELRRDVVDGIERGGRSRFKHLFARLRAACQFTHRAIMDAKVRRLENELMSSGWDEQECGEQRGRDHIASYPQRPLVLGDKWDF